MSRRPAGARTAVVLTTLALSLGSVACGEQDAPAEAVPTELAECREQWGDVAETVVGLDQDTDPSALASRWTSVVATIDYYENTDTAEGCQANIETQVKAITLLRQFSEKLRPYDMQYQLDQVTAAIDLYLHDPLPAPARNENGKMVRPPTHAAVTTALETLTTEVATATSDLQPGWAQLASVELTDEAAVTTALQDLDFLAQDSASWRRCQASLQVLLAAVRAQEGSVGSPSATPSATPSGDPGATPSATPGGTPSGTPSVTPGGTPTGTPTG